MGRKKLPNCDKFIVANFTLEEKHLKLLKKGKTASEELRKILDEYIELKVKPPKNDIR